MTYKLIDLIEESKNLKRHLSALDEAIADSNRCWRDELLESNEDLEDKLQALLEEESC